MDPIKHIVRYIRTHRIRWMGIFEEYKERTAKRTTERRPIAARLADRVQYARLVDRG
jgi:hypothetical protein